MNSDRQTQKSNRFIIAILAALVLAIAAVWVVFTNLIAQYNANITKESAAHLLDINSQIQLYVEAKIENDWNVARSLANSINVYTQQDADDIFTLLENERRLWNVSNIMLYTESGLCISADRDVMNNDAASDMVYNARRNGRHMTIMYSTVTYTIPIQTRFTINGSPVIAVSVTQELDSFVDNMGFESFGGAAAFYLLQENGVTISRLTHPEGPQAYNIYSLFDLNSFECLTHKGHRLGESTEADEGYAYTYRNTETNRMSYAVFMPIETGGAQRWRSLYLVPESIVNASTNSFSHYITTLSLILITIVTVIGAVVFVILYRTRKKAFDSALMARDRMVDVLVNSTSYAFALFSIDQAQPLYLSSNVLNIIGESYLCLARRDGRFLMYAPGGGSSPGADAINATLSSWDGTGEFLSDYISRPAPGGQRYYVMRITPSGSAGEYVAIAQDVTSEREHEDALKTALALADSASHAKTQFLANMSHDIRTPMNAITNMTRFAMKNMDDPGKHMEYLNTILDSSDHLLTLINDILDMSRIESGQSVIAAQHFSLSKLLNDVCDMAAPLYNAKNHTFVIDYSGLTSDKLIGDQLKLSQVLINLISNAVKFTPDGGRIYFVVKDMPSLRENTAALHFSVKDTGIGISEDFMSNIFEPFTRDQSDPVKEIEGTGLGLSICRSYVTAMGGSISCHSAPGSGSEFVVELSFERDTQEAAAQPEPQEDVSFEGQRALLCEDNLINQEIARQLLEDIGFAVSIACDGGEALKMYAAEPLSYDIIYMDIRMPVMDGYEATGRIRSSGCPGARRIPIVAMTANVFSEDIEKARAAGMNGHIGKPLVPAELTAVTLKALKWRAV